ncbi:MAG: hypothetical protein FJ295_01035 [Planctomycetes bacterium]|nr:hypothetical protein [Planctomycetota bacterium]
MGRCAEGHGILRICLFIACLLVDRAAMAEEGTRTQSIILAHDATGSCRIVRLADGNQLDVEIDGVPRRLALSQLVAWGTRIPLQSRGTLELRDGSLIAIDQIPKLVRIASTEKGSGAGASEAAMELVDGALSPLRIPLRCVAAIHMVLPTRLGSLGQLADGAASGGSTRLASPASSRGHYESATASPTTIAGSLEFRNADVLSGRWLDPELLHGEGGGKGGGGESGGGEGGGATAVRWRTSSTTLTVPWERIAAIRLRVRGAAARRGNALFGFQDGTLLAVNRWENDGGPVRLTLACGVELSLPPETLWGEWNSLESLDDELLYLSDIEPLAYRCVPFLSLEWPLGRDRSTIGENLTLRGRVISKGLGMHATSRVAYDVSQGYARFSAELALDGSTDGSLDGSVAGSTREQGSVVCRVAIDAGDGEWTTPYTSAVLRGGGRSEAVSIDISGASRLALIVESADRGDVADRLNWLRARLTRLPNGPATGPAAARSAAAPGGEEKTP